MRVVLCFALAQKGLKFLLDLLHLNDPTLSVICPTTYSTPIFHLIPLYKTHLTTPRLIQRCREEKTAQKHYFQPLSFNLEMVRLPAYRTRRLFLGFFDSISKAFT